MAMLAEPRRKKRYNLCPRGKALYEDDSRFGTKMLEKMGWSKGRGLGANEDGSQEFVRVRFKNDAEGFGYEARDDQWTVHEEGFNGLLKALNGEENNENEVNGGAASASEDEGRPMGFGFKAEPVVAEQAKPKSLKEKISGVSLEEKSKVSKARVHYKKFTRGKDLAQYSEKDLANIFGKKATDAIDTPVVQVIPEPEAEEEEKPLNPNFGGVQTVSTGLSVNDYFKMKMEAMKQRLKQNASNAGEESKPVNGEDAQPEAIVANGTEEQPIKKKKKKKDKERDRDEPVNTEEPQPEADEEQPVKKKKKKKDKEQEKEPEQQIEITETAIEQKKKKKDKEQEKEPEQQIEITEETAPEQKKKKKSKRTAEDEPAQLEDTVVESEESNPPKRKKKKKDKQEDTVEVESTLPDEETSVSEPKKKKKSKKSEDSVEEETAESQIQTEQPEKPAKKKSKKNKADDKEESPAELEPKEETESKSKRKSKKTNEVQEESAPVEISEESATKSKKKSKKNELQPQPEVSTAAEPISKKKKKKSKNHEPEVSADDDSSDSSATAENTVKYLTHEQLVAKLESFNVYTISSFCAEKFHVVDMKRFKNSTLPQIPGYNTDENVKLKIVEVKNDANRILSLWENRSDKYGKSKGPFPRTNNYFRHVTPTAIKAIRRTQAFTGI